MTRQKRETKARRVVHFMSCEEKGLLRGLVPYFP